MQGTVIKTEAYGTTILCSLCTDAHANLDTVEHMPIDARMERSVECNMCDIEIDGVSFSLHSTEPAEYEAWLRYVRIEYGGEVYTIELSFSFGSSYTWSALDMVPQGLASILNRMDLAELDRDL